MQIAEILSDLTSLRVCDYEAALALVTSYKTLHPTSQAQLPNQNPAFPTLTRQKSIQEEAKDDPDLKRALDLVDLHYGVKEKHMQGADMGLKKARMEVQRVMDGLDGGKRVKAATTADRRVR
ncbi:hypothetical protein MMC19_003273 [Ptychographa xylographoides]|nr:hypothetical protein [Ptychographa xylographoides]